MHLKNIKLAGFKSFVDPTTVPFTKNLIAVVGPNGCGKSNIVDAIRWVMGESSAKTLRGESMADVIFNGSTSRKPVGQASVQLTFDNSDGSIGGAYAEYAEIAIKRVASRDGTSAYFLNNTKCRRKDITDVFLGTGLGPRSYSVIEQGMISRFIEAKPDDLRMFIEEAAGISKYKERRRETETRIRHTRENLDRVEDLRDEIGKQLEKLQRQAKAAERYKVLKQDERLNKAQLHTLHWQDLDVQMQGFDRIIKEAEVLIEERIAEQRQIGTQIEMSRESQLEASDEMNEIQGRFYGLGADLAKIEQSITHHKERYEQLQEDKARIEESVVELQQNTQEDQLRLTSLKQELIQVEPKFGTAKQSKQGSGIAFAEAEKNMQIWRDEWNIFTEEASKSLQIAEVEQTRMRHAEQRIKEITHRLERLTGEQQQFDFTELQNDIGTLDGDKTEVASQVEQIKSQLNAARENITAQRQHAEGVTQQWDSAKENLQTAKGRYASLTALQQAALGEQDDRVVGWLEKNELSNNKRLAHHLRVDAGWEKAVETVLGTHLEAICIDDFDAVESLLADTPDGTFEFFIAGANEHNQQATADKLSQKVNSEVPVNSLLNTVYCVDDLTAAKAMLASLGAGESVITKEGLWLGPSWLRVAKDKDANVGILQREKQLSELKAEIALLEATVSELQVTIEQGKQAQRQSETEKDELQQEFNTINQQLANTNAKYQLKQQQLQQGTQRAEKLNQELSELQDSLQQHQQDLHEANNKWQHALSNSEQFATKKLDLDAIGNQHRERVTHTREQAKLDGEQCHQLEVRVEQLKPQMETLAASIGRGEKQLQILFERSSYLAESLEQGEGPVAELQIELKAVLDKRVSVEQELTLIRQTVENTTQQLREFEEAKEEVALKVEQLRRALEEKRLEGRTVEVRKKTFEEQVLELDYELNAVIEELPEEANIAAWEEESNKIITRISRLGAINLAAIDEFKVQEERKIYLDSQYDDLTEALTVLENAIHKIDKETRSRFKETFDKVNEGFQTLFPKVFGGGSAHLELTGDDLLNTGISVIARPPGKRNTTIHLLSGGEKALTAVSLVFAIFQLNPAPFCLLDEVDAPLDDANVERFCGLVKEMSAKVQFLFISHNKLAIEMAEQLTGVTMQEPGVSRIVAVDMEEAVQLAAA